jgi:hypothetical protein
MTKRKAEPVKRRRRKRIGSKAAPTKRRKRAAGTTRLKVDVTIPASLRLDGPELGQLSAAQRLELAAMGQRKRASLVPSWAADDRTWKRSARLLSRSWRRYEHPHAAVALLYLRSGGTVGGGAHRAGPGPAQRPGGRRKPGGGSLGADGLEVERVRVDELGYADDGTYYGPGEPLWRVSSGADSSMYVDTVVRARTASGARAIVAQQYGH